MEIPKFLIGNIICEVRGVKLMEIVKLIEQLEELIEQSSRLPMTAKVLIHEDILYNFVDRMRASLPEDVRQAEWILKERERILKEAEKEAQDIFLNANSKVEKMANDNEIVKLAKKQGEEIINSSKNVANEIRQSSLTYADDVMSQLQGELEKALGVIEEGRKELNKSINKKK